MGGSPQTTRQTLTAGWVVFLLWPAVTVAITPLYFEGFDNVQLRPPEQEFWPVPDPSDAFSHIPPSGWLRDAADVPGVNDPNVGIFEWEGWSFANRRFWTDVNRGSTQQPTARDFFDLAQGTVAVADPDRWNDLGDPANNFGFFNTQVRTRPIQLTPAPGDDTLTVVFDSSWVGGCCDDGQNFDPGGNNQTGIVRARIGTQTFELLRWESAPFYDTITGRPTHQPLNDAGEPNARNEYFKPNNLSERVAIDLTPFLPDPPGGNGQRVAFSTHPSEIELEFAMEDAGDDGYWAFDSIEMASYSTLLGDMNLSGVLDMGDFEAFALGMLDEEEYRFTYFGEFPESRGSLDSNFDFDDAAWFVAEMDKAGVSPSAAVSLALALGVVPEPTAGVILLLAATLPCSGRRGWRR